jgi:hypothetical protein
MPHRLHALRCAHASAWPHLLMTWRCRPPLPARHVPQHARGRADGAAADPADAVPRTRQRRTRHARRGSRAAQAAAARHAQRLRRLGARRRRGGGRAGRCACAARGARGSRCRTGAAVVIALWHAREHSCACLWRVLTRQRAAPRHADGPLYDSLDIRVGRINKARRRCGWRGGSSASERLPAHRAAVSRAPALRCPRVRAGVEAPRGGEAVRGGGGRGGGGAAPGARSPRRRSADALSARRTGLRPLTSCARGRHRRSAPASWATCRRRSCRRAPACACARVRVLHGNALTRLYSVACACRHAGPPGGCAVQPEGAQHARRQVFRHAPCGVRRVARERGAGAAAVRTHAACGVRTRRR